MSDTTQSQTLEQTLNKTDLGHTIYENRKILFGVLIAIVILASGYALWKQSQKSQALDHAQMVFEFESKVWSEVKSGKKSPSELVKSFEALPPSIQSTPAMLPVILEMTRFLFDKENFTEADAILSKVTGDYKHSVSTFFAHLQRAVVLEKLGKIDDAISVLEPLAQGKESVMPAIVSVQLGRLYLEKGEKGKAQTQFDYVINNFPNDEQAKLAKLYLAKMK